MDEEALPSLEDVQANQIFPRKHPVLEEKNLQVPYPELHGEFTEYVGRAEDAIIALSNYRLHIKFRDSVVNGYSHSCSCEVSVPLQLIECVECRDMFQLHITCKDCKVIRCQFSTFEQCQEWLKRLSGSIRPPSRLEDLFSFAFHAMYSGEKDHHGDLCRPGEHVTSRFKNEVDRMSFDLQNAWRISEINMKYRLCASYPQLVLVPAWITDKELESVASFRSWKRIPAVVYRHQSTGAVIARCGQPEVSWWGWRNADDEHLVQSIAKACAIDSNSSKHLSNGICFRHCNNGSDLSDVEFDSSVSNGSGVEYLGIQCQKLLILDARSYAAAVANRAKGGGCECPEYYPNCEVVFMGMANIHSIRKSFQSLRLLCTQMPDPGNWLSALEGTKWLQHLSMLLKSSLLVVNAVDRDLRPVLVHCSDGWDRTPQIVALSKLLLDPYYRTIEGFQVLVETEWLDFGHKFADRCGHGENSDDLNERCPVFLQWLDCVHQLQRQFPCSFEFNEAFLVKLVQHTYSCLFGTFLCNNAKEREDKHTQERTCSVWSLLRSANKAFRNMLYSSHSETVLHPVCHVRNLMLWSAVYLPNSSPSTPAEDSSAPFPVSGSVPEDQPLGSRLPKTRSFDNLSTVCEPGGSLLSNRRSSDPSLNDKWQEHRRSLEVNIGVGTEGIASQDQDNGTTLLGRALNLRIANSSGEELCDTEEDNHLPLDTAQQKEYTGAREAVIQTTAETTEEIELSVAVAEGQIENILQEATKEENILDDMEKNVNITPILSMNEESSKLVITSTLLPKHSNIQNVELFELPSDREPVFLNRSFVSEQDHSSETVSPVTHLPESNGALSIVVNGCSQIIDRNVNKAENHLMSPPTPPEQHEDRLSLLESSTETLKEEGCRQEVPLCEFSKHTNGKEDQLRSTKMEDIGQNKTEITSQRTLDGIHQPFPSALPPLSFTTPGLGNQEEPICNGESIDREFCSLQQQQQINSHHANGEKASLSRQVSGASFSSLPFHTHGSGSSSLQHRCVHNHVGRHPSSPEQPLRSHLDDDGLALHNDAIQQRLRQIEAGHQMEVETLKKQVQELWSRLESQHLGGSLRINGDMGDEVTSIADSESILDHNCLSRCSTELFSEASWEQVDKQDTEVTRWYPDHLAAQCYGCESRFWLASRKHHCRDRETVEDSWNCGNVFCASCCDQKIPVPSQQLFEPTRVCKTCYNHLQPSGTALEMDMEKPIAASSN
ncbi:myotubularin-related protein 3 isoform X1 [Erpetoichthys calabaricus]|uniref:myotubularin-related protein 3 isoform X1 n=1 Tax=Erpetoichthys calabaricus TaxID=27687 RepID=UPI0022347A9A|nr:myotubularin-related protein 3 isoform X1 [Erpetoichthys calabaricus]XP_051777509.1 myotubularin-related protein 3 isoform X1 [Erpetoichthys calabaricus]